MVNSSGLLLGGTISTPTVYISKKSTTSIQIRFSIPVGCGYVINNNQSITKECLYNLRVFTKSPWNCVNDGIANIVRHPDGSKFCSEPFKMLETASEWNNKGILHSFEIVTLDRNYEDGKEFYIQVAFDDTINHKFWKNYVFPDIKVIVSDTEACVNKMAYSHIDPHMRSINKLYYEQHKSGDFLFYKNAKYDIEVQERVKQCRVGSYVRCACGIVIRAGLDVFRIDQCGNINFLHFTNCGDKGNLNVVRIHDRKYRVITKIGTRIDVVLNKGIPRTLNIDLFMSPKDFQNVEGLCGHFDAHNGNRLHHSDGSYTEVKRSNYRSEPITFTDSWRIPNEHNLFINQDIVLGSVSDANDVYCICNGAGSDTNGTICATTQHFGCYSQQSIREEKCQITSRKKRSSSKQNSFELKRLFFLMQQSEVGKVKREISKNITATDATSLCSAIKASFVAVNLSDILADEDIGAVIYQCENDVIEMNDPNMVKVHIETLNNLAKAMLELNPSYADNNAETIEYFLSSSCPQNCSDHGTCSRNSECICNEGFSGSDCGIDMTELLVIDDIEGGGVCDIANEECKCFYIRTDNLLSNFTCSVNLYTVDLYGNSNIHSKGVIQGNYEDLFTGLCCLLDNQAFRNLEMEAFTFVYDFALSNDGEHYGPVKSVYLYDSTCQNIITSSVNSITVVLRTDFCYINRFCIFGLQNNTRDNCTFCKPGHDVLEWTSRPECTVNTENEADYRMLLLPISGACICVGIAILITVICKHYIASKLNRQTSCKTTMARDRQLHLQKTDGKIIGLTFKRQQIRPGNILIQEIANRRITRPVYTRKLNQQTSSQEKEDISVIDLE